MNAGVKAENNTLMLQGNSGPRCYLTAKILDALEQGDYEGGGRTVSEEREAPDDHLNEEGLQDAGNTERRSGQGGGRGK